MTEGPKCADCGGTGKDATMVALNRLGAVALERCGGCNGTGEAPRER